MNYSISINRKYLKPLYKAVVLILFSGFLTTPLMAESKNCEGPLAYKSAPGVPFYTVNIPQKRRGPGPVSPAPLGYFDKESLEKFKRNPRAYPIPRQDVTRDKSPAVETKTLDSRSGLENDFHGIDFQRGIPPDPTLAAGRYHVIVAVNSAFAIFTKDGTPVYQTTFDEWFKSVLPFSRDRVQPEPFDPKVIYDHYNDRWVMLALYVDDHLRKSYYLLSVSQGPDPLAGWWNWALDTTLDGMNRTNNWADYPEIGLDDESIYLSSNQFGFDIGNQLGSFSYAKIRILKKSEAYSGGSLRYVDFWNLTNPDGDKAFTVKPCVSFDSCGCGEYMVNTLGQGGMTDKPGVAHNSVVLWHIRDPWGRPQLDRVAVPVKPLFPTPKRPSTW